MTARRERWLRQWVAACRANTRDEDIIALSSAMLSADLLRAVTLKPRHASPSKPLQVVENAVDWLRWAVPQYRFEGETHRTMCLADARRRVSPVTKKPGWWACSDSSAAVAAVALLAGCVDVKLAYEQLPPEHQQHSAVAHSYAHAQVVADGVVVDALSEFALKAGVHTRLEDVKELLRWPTSAPAR